MDPSRRLGVGVTRRLLLRALALVPAALAGCAGGKAASARGTPAGGGSPAAGGAPAEPVRGPLRDFPLPADAAPAFIFRAAAARPGER